MRMKKKNKIDKEAHNVMPFLHHSSKQHHAITQKMAQIDSFWIRQSHLKLRFPS